MNYLLPKNASIIESIKELMALANKVVPVIIVVVKNIILAVSSNIFNTFLKLSIVSIGKTDWEVRI